MTALFDSNGKLVGGMVRPAAELGGSVTYAKTGACGLGDLGSALGGWLYDKLHPNTCH